MMDSIPATSKYDATDPSEKTVSSAPGTTVADDNIETMDNLLTRGQEVVQDLGTLGASVGRLAQEASRSLHTLAKERPYVVVALAAGVGFVIAGGLGTRVTTSLLRVGGRMLMRTMVAGTLGAIAAGEGEVLEDSAHV